ncbi:MAG: T9SS type A sorting domain-containing protein, partial [Bacteroidales bacterium]|nr:T9SS type A sorting domain-containing protein [Bacteroidales bacterium]
PLSTGIASCPMCMDSDGNLYFATGISYGGPDTLPWTVVLDEDTNRMYDFYLPGRDEFSAIHNMMIFKFSPTFDLVWTKLIVEHTEGLSPYIPIDTVNPHFTPCVFGMSVDSDNNLYLSGYLMDMWMTDQYNQYPIRIYWDSSHVAIVDDYGLAFYMPFIIKYNSNGNVLWSNQAFVRNPPENSLPNAISWMDNYVHNNSIYLVGWIGHFDGTNATYYFDNMSNVLNVSQSTTYFVRFNKNTGGYENSGAVPGNKTNVSYGDPIRPAVINNHLMHMTRNYMIDNNYHLLCYYNTDGTFQRADTIYHLYSVLAGGQNVVVNQHGQILCDFINKQDLSFGNDFTLDFSDNQHFHTVFALRYDPSILEPYPEDSTGVVSHHELKNPIKLYPNPAANTLYIESEDATIDHIVVLDLTGKEILRQDIFNNRGETNVSSLPNGLYIVKALCNGSFQISKFVKSDF